MLEQTLLTLVEQSLIATLVSIPDWVPTSIPDWFPEWLRIAVVLLSGGLVTYVTRLIVERRKLRRALKTEIKGMDGLKSCKNEMESRKKPSKSSASPITAKEVPSEQSISTQVYDENVQQLGLLGTDELESFVSFYTNVKKYKSIIEAIRSEENVPEPDQNELWENIDELENRRENLFGEGWMED